MAAPELSRQAWRPPVYPFAALVGQERLKLALLLNAVDPGVGGLLVRGQRGTAKTTAVRALAALLPDQEVVLGCRFHCDPASPECDECLARLAAAPEARLPSATLPMRVVELPANASEDRVVGSLDLERAVRSGQRHFQPGLLAEANRSVLYVDEVNLLDDHIVDALLDAAAMGWHVVEREGVSFAHPASFLLVGSMNPEEGELRPQLLDRFGLCVDVAGIRDIEQRLEIVEREAAFREDAERFTPRFAAAQGRLRSRIGEARRRLERVRLGDAERETIAALTGAMGVQGHRADLVTARAACAIAAWRGRLKVELGDMEEAAAMALPHRAQGQPFRVAAAAMAASAHSQQEAAPPSEGRGEPNAADRQPSDDSGSQSSAGDLESGLAGESGEESTGGREGAAHLVEGDEPWSVRRMRLPRDRKERRGRGRRTTTRSATRRGRYVRATEVETVTDLALDATLRAAAPHQTRRRSASPGPGPALRVERQDMRQKVRDRKVGNLIVFLVDASASMDAEKRMSSTKGAVLSLLIDAYQRRDKVALITFRDRTARVVLPPTNSAQLAQRHLDQLAVGGTTPLTHGLLAALDLIRIARRKDQAVFPLLVLLSDGRGNVSLGSEKPVVEAERVAEAIRAEGIRAIVIDSAKDYSKSRSHTPRRGGFFDGLAGNICMELAERMGARYFGLLDLSQSAIINSVQQSLS